jgi:hypothetical protein
MDGRYAKTRLRLTAGMKKRLGLGGARQPRTISGQTIRIQPCREEPVMKLTEQKPANALPSNPPSWRTPAIRADDDHEDDAPLPLPHETDQSAKSQHEVGTRAVGRQAYQDLSRGLTDTDRRGGDAYQQRTQNDANANTRSSEHEARRKR